MENNKTSPVYIGNVIFGIFALAFIAFCTYMYGAQIFHGLSRFFLTNPLFSIAVIAAAVIAITALVKQSITEDQAKSLLSIAVLIAMLAFLVLPLLSFGRWKAYAASVEIEDEVGENISYRPRTPYEVAESVSDRNLGATTGESIKYVKALPAAGENALYTTAVIRRGFAQGYESVQTMDLPLYGSTSSKDVTFCQFDTNAGKRIGGGLPSNNLGRSIMWKTPPSVGFSNNDAFFYCDGDTPLVYVPLTKIKSNFLYGHKVPYGVAIYNGSTGELNIEKNYEGNLPVYPISLAQKQRSATKANGTFMDFVFGRAGFETTDKDVIDNTNTDSDTEDDTVNGANLNDYSLAGEDGKNSYYVTPLTSRGSSSSIIAIGNVESNVMENGNLNTLHINKYDKPQQARSAIASRIISEELSGYRAQGLEVFEIVPEKDGNWVATIGQKQTVIYRATISPDGNIKLQTVDKSAADKDDNGDNKDSKSLNTTADKNLEDMSVEELQDLANEILTELSTRAKVTDE